MGDMRLTGVGSQPEKVKTLGPGYLSSVHPEWRPSMDKRPKKSPRKTEGFNLNEFPDEILVEILSKMEVRDAAKTCVVSRRWKNLWTFSTNLDFGAKPVEFRHSNWHVSDSNKIKELNNGVKYRDCVNHVLLNHKHQLNSLELALDMEADNPDNSSTLNKWIAFAFSKQVRVLGLDLNHTVYRSSTPLAPVLHTSGILRNARLTELYLKSVSVSNIVFQHLLHSCPNLETLSVENSPELAKVAVLGNALRLNQLEIRYCQKLSEIEIVSAPNLVSFKLARHNPKLEKFFVSAPYVSFKFEKNPKLSRVSLEGYFCVNMISEIQRCVPLMEELELNMHLIREMSLIRDLHLPGFSNVKQLKLIFEYFEGSSLMELVLLMMACPSLKKLTLMYGPREGYDYKPVLHKLDDVYSHFDESTMKSYDHQCLQVVEFLGWCGYKGEVEFAEFVMKTARHLKDLVFYVQTPHCLDESGAEIFREFNPVAGAKERARRQIEKFKIIKSSRG